jgi:hypothetical protein
MNTFLTKIKRPVVWGFLGLILLSACKKDVITQYQIRDVALYSSASEKKNLKSDEQFISIMYTDIFEKSISNEQMLSMNKAYTSIGDKSLIIDILTKGLLTDQGAKIPSMAQMRANPKAFVEETYKRFLIRLPSPQEEWFLMNQINNNSKLEPIDIYYAMLTSEEYRYY